MNTKNEKGFLLVGIMAVLLTLLILLPALISWVGKESRSGVKHQRSTLAFNLAESAVDRGMWKLKESTGTWATAVKGDPITDYDGSKSFTDIAGGMYKIRFTAGVAGSREVTVDGVGVDLSTKEKRAIRAVFKNQSIQGPVLSGGIVKYSDAFQPHWGPVMALNNINITGAKALTESFPRKYSRQVVVGRDPDGTIDGQNTDNVEWWSDYEVPQLPRLDFVTLKSSAQATNTYNVHGCSLFAPTIGAGCPGAPQKAWWPVGKKGSGDGDCLAPGPHSEHFQNSFNHPLAKGNYVWYWDDGNVVWSADHAKAFTTNGQGLHGTVIVNNLGTQKSNFTLYSDDALTVTNAPIPANAWQEYRKIDTGGTNDYPGDNGLGVNRKTFNFGGPDPWTGWNPSYSPVGRESDVAVRGLVYVTNNLIIPPDVLDPVSKKNISSYADFFGALWIGGNIVSNSPERTLVFFDDTLDLPVLNVVLVRQSWREVPPW